MHLVVTSAPTLEDREAVVVGIAAFEWTHADIEAQPLAILVRDDDSVLIAGLIGRTAVSWLFGVIEDCPPGDRRMSLYKRLDRAAIVDLGASG